MKYQLLILKWSTLVVLYSTIGGIFLVIIVETLIGVGKEISTNPEEVYITTSEFFIILFSQIVGLALALAFGEPPQKSE